MPPFEDNAILPPAEPSRHYNYYERDGIYDSPPQRYGQQQPTSYRPQSYQYGEGVGIPSLRPNEQANPYDVTTYRNLNLVDVYMDARRSVVSIHDSTGEKGTGFFVTRDGLLATDYHVVDDDSNLRVVTSDGRVYRARIESVDHANDLALLQVERQSAYDSFAALKLGDSNSVARQGTPVMALGHPQGWDNVYLSPGAFNYHAPYWRVAQRGTLPSWNNEQRTVLELYMHTRAGSSGSPVLDMNGRVVGVVDLSNHKNETTATPVEALERLLAQTWQRRQYTDQQYAYYDRRPSYSYTHPAQRMPYNGSYYGSPAPRYGRSDLEVWGGGSAGGYQAPQWYYSYRSRSW